MLKQVQDESGKPVYDSNGKPLMYESSAEDTDQDPSKDPANGSDEQPEPKRMKPRR